MWKFCKKSETKLGVRFSSIACCNWDTALTGGPEEDRRYWLAAVWPRPSSRVLEAVQRHHEEVSGYSSSFIHSSSLSLGTNACLLSADLCCNWYIPSGIDNNKPQKNAPNRPKQRPGSRCGRGTMMHCFRLSVPLSPAETRRSQDGVLQGPGGFNEGDLQPVDGGRSDDGACRGRERHQRTPVHQSLPGLSPCLLRYRNLTTPSGGWVQFSWFRNIRILK